LFTIPAHRDDRLVTGGRAFMPIEMLTYAALAGRLNCSPEAARAVARRHRLPRHRSNDGKTLVAVDLTEIEHTPSTRTPPAWTARRHLATRNIQTGSIGEFSPQ
jgi:hypothetical protein